MRMSAQYDIEPSVGSLPIDFGRMREQNRKDMIGDIGSGPLDVINSIIMGVVDPGKIDVLLLLLNRRTFIEQHFYSHAFQTGNHADRIMITQNSVDRTFYSG